MVEQIGAMIEVGPEDWQIVQQVNGWGGWSWGGGGSLMVRGK